MYTSKANLIFLLGIVHSLKFNSDGSFKILQSSDIHLKDGDAKCQDIGIDFGECSSANTTYFLSRVLDSENPDFVAFTGDLIDWGTSDAAAALDTITDEVIERNIYWGAVLGNHDGQSSLSRDGVIEYLSGKKYSITQLGPDNVYGYGNYFGSIYHNQSKNMELIFVDSGAYNDYKIKDDSDYDWVHSSQVDYVKNNTKNDLPKLIFFHIPLNEYQDAVEENPASGQKQERISPGSLNGGLFAGLIDVPNTIAAFVGHDHVNDYCTLYNGIQLCYAGGMGYTIYGKTGWPRRQRVINIKDFGDTIETYKILDDDELSIVDFEVIYSKNDPTLVEEYMEQRKMLYFHTWTQYQILTIVFGSLFIICLIIFIILGRKKLKKCFGTCCHKTMNCFAICLGKINTCCLKCKNKCKRKNKDEIMEGQQELLNNPAGSKRKDIYKSMNNNL